MKKNAGYEMIILLLLGSSLSASVGGMINIVLKDMEAAELASIIIGGLTLFIVFPPLYIFRWRGKQERKKSETEKKQEGKKSEEIDAISDAIESYIDMIIEARGSVLEKTQDLTNKIITGEADINAAKESLKQAEQNLQNLQSTLKKQKREAKRQYPDHFGFLDY